MDRVDKHGPIDVSKQNNGFSASSSDGFFQPQFSEHQEERGIFKLSEGVEATDLGVDNPQKNELLPQPSESVEPERVRENGRCNLRKSLAWDTAFFTNAGVLDAEELSSMIDGVDRGGKSVLPGIEEEDVLRSIDSISTLESDSLTLETLEADLFQDIRASIQKSSKAASARNSSNKAGSTENEVQTMQSSRKLDLASRSKVKPKLNAKSTSISGQGSGRMKKESSICQQVNQATASNGGSISSLPKLPMALCRAGPIAAAPTKRVSLAANGVKMEKDNAKISAVVGRGPPSSRVAGLGGSRGVLPRPTLSLKSSSSCSSTATKIEPTTSCFSRDSSGSTSCDNVGKSPLIPIRRKVDSRAVNPPSSSSKVPSRSKTQLGISRLSAHLKSSIKLSSSISPASSISEWSCESSSSTSTVNKRSINSKASMNSSSPCKGISVNSDAPAAQISNNQSDVQFSVGHEVQATGLLSQHVNEAAAGTCPPSAKPSGLRMPSPKIGFFDGMKSVVRTPKGGVQSHTIVPSDVPNSVPNGSTSSGGLSSSKLRDLQRETNITAIRKTKPDTQKTLSSMKPISLTPLKDPSNDSIKVSSARRAVRNCPGLSPKIQNVVSSKSGGKSQLKTKEDGALGPDRTKRNPDSCLKNKMSSEIKGRAQSKNVKITPVDIGSLSDSVELFENGNDGLRGSTKSMNLSKEMKKELIDNFVPQSDVKCADNRSSPESSCSKEVQVFGQTDEFGNILSIPPLSSFTSDITAGNRIPFAVKNSFGDREEAFEFSKEKPVKVVEKIAHLTPLESSQKENS